MIATNPLFNEQRAAQAAAYLLWRAGGSLQVVKLMKLLYLAERLCLERYGEPLTGDNLFSLQHGPILSMTLNLISGKAKPVSDWKRWLADRKEHDVSLSDMSAIHSPADFTHLAEIDLEALEETWNASGHMDTWELVRYTHDELPEWQDPGKSSQPISYTEILRSAGWGEEAIKNLVERLEAQKSINRTLAAA
ncbi:MAG: SocA family protein [Planctomycetota bacterium]|jgi:uncharacterized phage-associated protein|nr:SocA family protein [Planctomycetota bacterium]